jgi:hypothetical protein
LSLPIGIPDVLSGVDLMVSKPPTIDKLTQALARLFS